MGISSLIRRQMALTSFSNIMRRFPTLEILDKEAVTKISFDAPQTPHPTGSSGSHPIAKDFPALIQAPLIAGVDGGIITSFFARYASSLPSLPPFFSMVPLASSHSLIHRETCSQTCITNSPLSRSKPIHPFQPVPKSKDSNTQKRCRINAIWNGPHGWVLDPEISVEWQVRSTRC